MRINETVLEMHYHKPLMDTFRETFGLGNGGQVNFYKYSPQKECFIGFDQAYVRSDLGEDEFFDLLRRSASDHQYAIKDSFVGYFLQFKVVSRMKYMTKFTPTCITKRPHFRVALDTKKNHRTGSSQHELLWRLKKNNDGAMVYYACPMIFDKEELYEVNVSLDNLSLVDLSSCPQPYQDDEAHHIYFNEKIGDPIWCSDPVRGRSVTPKEFAELLTGAVSEDNAMDSAKSLIRTLNSFRDHADNLGENSESYDDVFAGIYSGKSVLTIVRVTRGST